MFEVGKTYSLRMIISGQETTFGAEVLAWEAPLLRVKDNNGEIILNTSASNFVSATPLDSNPLAGW